MQSGPEGDRQHRRIREAEIVRQRLARCCVDDDLFGVRTPRRRSDHPLSHGELGDALADRGDRPRHFEAGGEGKRRFGLVLACDQQDVGIVDAGGLGRDADLARSRLGNGDDGLCRLIDTAERSRPAWRASSLRQLLTLRRCRRRWGRPSSTPR